MNDESLWSVSGKVLASAEEAGSYALSLARNTETLIKIYEYRDKAWKYYCTIHPALVTDNLEINGP